MRELGNDERLAVVSEEAIPVELLAVRSDSEIEREKRKGRVDCVFVV